MLIGVPRETKAHEYRVGLTPDSTRELIAHGHKVIVETQCGKGIGSSDQDYLNAGASITSQPEHIFQSAELIVKVKEPQPHERKMLRENQILYTYLHLAPDPEQTKDLVESGAICIAYETVVDNFGRLPLLAPMSQVAGRMSIQAGAYCLEKSQKGKGILLGGIPGVAPARVVVIGGGVVGKNAIDMALGMGADVTVLDRNVDVLESLVTRFGTGLKTQYSTQPALKRLMLDADLVVGAVLVKGAAAPKLLRAELLANMKPGSALVDVAIDQGGCFETSRPTTHSNPTYVIDDIVHYCVTNMPGAVPKTATCALNNVTLPYIISLADLGYKKALNNDPGFLEGLNICQGKVTCKAVADALGYIYTPATEMLI